MHAKEREISAYLDDSLPEDRKNALKQHFSVCEECRRKLSEWEKLYDTIDMLEFNFSLEGLEQKVLAKIRSETAQPVPLRVLIAQTVYVLLSLFLVGLFISPATQMAGQTLQKAGGFLLDAGIRFVNEFKWYAMDVISFIQDLSFLSWVFLLISGITLIAGGMYYSLSGRLHKA